MSFEVYVRPPAPGRPLAHPAVSVGNGVLHLNTKARQALGDPDRILLLRDGKDIAFKPAAPGDTHSYAITKGNVSCSEFVRAAALLTREKFALQLEDGLLRTVGRE